MKYPLRVVEEPRRICIADADHRIVCEVKDNEWGRQFADFIVRDANRWRRFRPWFRPRTKEDWEWERNEDVKVGPTGMHFTEWRD
jgi:hypothetical protein